MEELTQKVEQLERQVTDLLILIKMMNLNQKMETYKWKQDMTLEEYHKVDDQQTQRLEDAGIDINWLANKLK